MITFPIAKINLGLNVVERRPDGYHNLETVFYPVPLKDALEVHAMDEGFPSAHDCDLKVTFDSRQPATAAKDVGNGRTDAALLMGDERKNLVVRAYGMLKQDFPTLPRLHVHLWKGIPMQAGMGGGSSDGAYMLQLLNSMCRLGLTDDELTGYAARLGADCAFFVKSRPCYAEGIGERLKEVTLSLAGWHLGVVRPDIPVPTREAFARIRPHRPLKNCLTVTGQPVETWRQELVNDFEESVFARHPELADVKQRLYDMGATYAAMSGSVSALFGLFRDAPGTLSQEFPGMFTFCSLL